MGGNRGLPGTDATSTDAVGAESDAVQNQTQKWPASEGLQVKKDLQIKARDL
jgi:hypothetical protein